MIPSHDTQEAADYNVSGPPEPPGDCVLVNAEQDQLLLDLDGEAAVKRFVELLPFLFPYGPIERIRCWPSRSKGMHVVIELPHCVFWPAEKFALQAILGSDPKREMALMRDCVLRSQPESEQNVLFQPKERGWSGPRSYPEPAERKLLPSCTCLEVRR